jgi:DNA-binding MarR family transcriptional regulator
LKYRTVVNENVCLITGNSGRPADYPGRMDVRGGDDLGLALSVVLRAYLEAAEGVLSEVAGGARGYQILASAAHHAPPTQLALAQQLGIDRSVLTYLLDDLEGCKLIERRPDPADRRARRIVLTKAGEAKLTKLGKRLTAAEQHALRGLDEADQKTLRELLWRASSTAATGESACQIVADVQESLAAAPAPARRTR